MKRFIGRIQLEDVILYTITAIILFYCIRSFEKNHDRLFHIIDNTIANSNSISSFNEDMKIRYGFATEVLASNSSRNNMSFLVGTVLCLLGLMVVVRRVRSEIEGSMTTSGEKKFGFQTSSPGVFMALIGGLIIIFSITFKDHYTIQDPSLQNSEKQQEPKKDTTSYTPPPQL
ncbi:MAG: hypothetical protein JWQ09_1256 [Segetibacter sp.]|nr:hypothetical protein [Segetibacter sp.]